jgi:hypothetical protein
LCQFAGKIVFLHVAGAVSRFNSHSAPSNNLIYS